MTVKELERELETTRAGISNLNGKLDKSQGFDLELTVEIQALREHERRTCERLEEATRRQRAKARERERARLLGSYETAVEAVRKAQATVETIVSTLMGEAEKLRQADREMRRLAIAYEKNGGVLSAPPVRPLWQKHGGTEYPYCDRVRRALKNL